jgi:enoyl-CoA hydratase/carnithine racemase
LSDTANPPSYRTLLTTVNRGVATITLNRLRQRNAIGDGMRDELADARGGSPAAMDRAAARPDG